MCVERFSDKRKALAYSATCSAALSPILIPGVHCKKVNGIKSEVYGTTSSLAHDLQSVRRPCKPVANPSQDRVQISIARPNPAEIEEFTLMG